MHKISVIGAGNVGATLAQRLFEKSLGNIVLVDVAGEIAKGKALDISQSGPIEEVYGKITGTGNFSEIKYSDVVVVTAGLPRQPGMSREDLLAKNAEVISSVAEQIKKYSPGSIVVVVTNPLDVMTQLVQKTTGFDPKRVVGMAGLLDSARLSTFIAMKLECLPAEVHSLVLGSHGDSMVPVISQTNVKGKPINRILSKDEIGQLVERARAGGAEIVKYLKTGSAYYAPGSCAAYMVAQILKDKKDTISCSCYLNGQYDLRDVYIGVPCQLGKRGVEKIIEIDLTPEEKTALHKSAEIVKQNIKNLF